MRLRIVVLSCRNLIDTAQAQESELLSSPINEAKLCSIEAR